MKYKNWKVSNQTLKINDIFDNNETITISRGDLLNPYMNTDEHVITVLMWGYPTKGRGNNIDSFLEQKKFNSFIDKLELAKKDKHISIDVIKDLMKNSTGLGFSTLSKILYFSKINYEAIPALILDSRIIKALSSGRFKDSGIEQFRNLRPGNEPQKYIYYLDFMKSLAKKMNTEADRVEMFLYQFGSNLKDITEKVFEVLGEGGGICISRQVDKSRVKFIYHHSEFDPTSEGLDKNKKCEYNNFEQPFQLINDRYPWYLLYLETVHDDYRNYIIERLIEKLNHKSAMLDNFEYHKGDLENSLKIKLNNTINKHTNELTWSYEKIK